jgi:CHAT domain-containing protein
MEELLAFLVQHEAQQGRPQQSLIDADRLLVLAASDEKPQALNLGDDEKSRAILQLRELEARVQRLAGKDGRGSERGGQPDAVNPELALARQELKAWLTQMRSQYPAATALLKPEPLDLARLQQQLGPDRALIQYVLLPRQSFAWVVTREAAVVVPIAQGEAQLRAWVGAARSQYTPGIALRSATVSGQRTDSAEASAQGNPQEAMQQLSRALIEPVRAAADGKSHWIIVPHGSLHALAFAALPSPGDGSPLVLRKTLSVIASAATFAGTPDSAAKPSRKLLALGNPTSPDPQWSRLPSAEIEARRIAQINGAADSTVLIGAAATRTSLLGQSLARTALHLALHGEARSGDASRLVFADGYLSVKDIWSLALDGSPRVVLSACETGLGESLTGNEVLSIGNGFLFAGAQSVVSSLWRVPDEDTRALMEAFYTELTAGKTTAQAMSAAQRQAIVQGRSARAWAAFVVNGL